MYHDGHRLFLQAFISSKMLTEVKTKQMYTKVCNICEVDGNPDEFNDFLHVINKKLEPLFMEIRRGRSEDDGKSFFSLVNTAEDEHSKLATKHAPHEIEFIKAALQMIVESQNGNVSTLDLVNIGMDLTKRVSAQAAEEILTKLAEDGWVKEKNGNVYFGPRSIIELGQYMKNKFKDQVTECMLCHDLVIMGDICEDCGLKVHKYCATLTFQKLPANKRKCPQCKEPWLQELTSSAQNNNTTNGAVVTNGGDAETGTFNPNVPVIPIQNGIQNGIDNELPGPSGQRSKRSSKMPARRSKR